MEKIKLGIIGLNEGNGHPYSWAAICNGFNMEYMKDCPFPVIPEYLSKEKYPDNFIDNAVVTHIWTQDRRISEHVAHASKIENIVDDYHEMIGVVDGILLARDDAENHFEMCRYFVQAGMMIYIDKPLAFDIDTAKKIFALEKFDGQIFSCSAMKYAREIDENIDRIKALGHIDYIDATVMKRWDNYSPHIIDPILRILGEDFEIAEAVKVKNKNTQGCLFTLASGTVVMLTAHKNKNAPMSIRLFGENGFLEIAFEDTFYAFRGAIKNFIKSIEQKKSCITQTHIMKMVEIIERGL